MIIVYTTEEFEALKYCLEKCPRQKEIVEFLRSAPGATESEILLEVYNCDRKRGHNNKAGADAVRRALDNDFIKRSRIGDQYNCMGIYRYFADI